MIKELELIEFEEYVGFEKRSDTKMMRIPNNKEIMNKLNEVIRHINNKEYKGE